MIKAAKAAADVQNARTDFYVCELREMLDELDLATVRLLRAVETFGHNTFRHGRIERFNFTPDEVDFVYTTCVAGILIFAARNS